MKIFFSSLFSFHRAIIGEVDGEMDKRIELCEIMADPLNNVVH